MLLLSVDPLWQLHLGDRTRHVHVHVSSLVTRVITAFGSRVDHGDPFGLPICQYEKVC